MEGLKEYATEVARARAQCMVGDITWAEYRQRVEEAQTAYFAQVREQFDSANPEPFPGSSELTR